MTIDNFHNLGHHYILELSDCDPSIVSDNQKVKTIFYSRAKNAGLTILDQRSYEFSPQGFTFYILLAESHASIHVWPEFSYCAVDLFSCNVHGNYDEFFNELATSFGAKHKQLEVIERGYYE